MAWQSRMGPLALRAPGGRRWLLPALLPGDDEGQPARPTERLLSAVALCGVVQAGVVCVYLLN